MVLISNLILIICISFNFAYAEELKVITPESFISSNPSPERREIVDFLVNQFKDKEKKGVTQEDLDKLWNNQELREKYMMARFQIIDQKLYADSFYLGHYYFPVLLQYFQKLVTKYKISDVDFIIYLREEIPTKEDLGKQTMGVPAFIMFQDKASSYEMDKLLFPDAFFIKENKNSNWGRLLANIEKASENYPWAKKISKVFWRGVTTGDFHPYTIENFSKLPRLTISILSKLYPDLIDANFSAYSPQIMYEHFGPNLREFCQLLLGGRLQKANEADHLKYKYLISLDGNAATGTRVSWIMYSNSVLLKQESDKIQWYYSALKPYVNYVPVKHDLSDIFDQIEWMKENDAKVEQISINAHNFIQNNMLAEHIDSHTVILLNEYAKIQKDSQITPTLTASEDVVSLSSVIKMLGYRVNKYFKERMDTWF